MLKKQPTKSLAKVSDINILYTGIATQANETTVVSAKELNLEQEVSKQLLNIVKDLNKIRSQNEYIKQEKYKLNKESWATYIKKQFFGTINDDFKINHKDIKNFLIKSAMYHVENIPTIDTMELHKIHRNIRDMNDDLNILNYEIKQKRTIESIEYKNYKDEGTSYGNYTNSINKYVEMNIKVDNDYTLAKWTAELMSNIE